MDIALAQLALIFLPGILWARLDATYGAGPKVSTIDFFLNSFLFGVTAYVAVYFVYYCFSWEFTSAVIQDQLALTDFVDEVAMSIPISFVLAVLWLYAVRFRLVMRILNFIGATRRFGTEDVWSFTFNSTQKHVEYVDVRDLLTGRTFSGYVNAYSETEGFRELLLVDAIVYSEDGDELSRSPHLYLSFPKEQVWIDFPYKEQSDV